MRRHKEEKLILLLFGGEVRTGHIVAAITLGGETWEASPSQTLLMKA